MTVSGVVDGRITWSRLYMEAVDADGSIDEAVRGMTSGSR